MKKLIAIALGTGIALGVAIHHSIFPPCHEVVEMYRVKDGDTLWKICAEYCKKDCRKLRTFQMVGEVESLNPQLKTHEGLVLTGDKIKIRYMELD